MSNQYSMKIDINEESGEVEAKVREKDENGEWEVVDSQTFDPEGVHEKAQAFIRGYGLSKLMQDRSSSVATGPDKLSAMNEVFALLAEGKLQKERTRGAPTVSAEVEALAAIKNTTIPVIQKTLNRYDKETRDKILAHKSVQERAAEIRRAREGEQLEVDLEDLAG